ncbi:Rep family ATP-dependent DNA helicase [Haloactinopolyspora alba]|uniref:Rep family ATP-dependent DNA helicase n=1 Tax=Haloactinopolyspora alba TaxID=648780 RepID=A0A2P8EBH2_9ACTN|nr:AAA family ATPase [Haloactinopolyspora alba]PSL06824.1 Rep family ATP-dependent DNA helicase [Haloactinopolyspora alba]
MSEAELRAEIDHHDRVRDVVATMRESTVARLEKFEADFVESKQNRFAHDGGPDHNMGQAMAKRGEERLRKLADRDVPMFFGRLWFDSGADYHVGRLHVAHESDRSQPLVVDWRAPVAERFYRASVHAPQDVIRRRRFGFNGSTLTGFEDEDLRLGQDGGSDALAAEIERPRTGPMRDIVATIQPEQDELIRRGLDTTLCVQGAPGTGKTAVGLHRAAWLLYSFPDRLTRSGMLVVGPNENFLTYISEVLPALGERSVWQVTVDQLTGAADAPGRDRPEVSLVKHDARMAEACRRAVWNHRGHVEDRLVALHDGIRMALSVDYLTNAIDRVVTTRHTWEAGRKALEQAVMHGFERQFEERTRRSADGRTRAAIKRHPSVKEFFDTVWPRLTAKQVLRKLGTDEAFRAEICAGLLTAEETELLQAGKRSAKPSAADILLLDEVQAQLRPIEPEQTYAHIVVDEAQDLSPMQCRAVARRNGARSMTVLGDLAQGTTPWAAADWRTQMAHLGHDDAEHTELTTGYRVPAAIIELGNRVLPHLGVSVSPARSIRPGGTVDVIGSDDVVTATADAVERALLDEGLVGVIAPDDLVDSVRAVLPAGDRVELVASGLAKGLEYDHVVLVEPADVVLATDEGLARPDVGLRHLYVALTRAVSRLTIVHARPLPAELDDANAVAPAVASRH